MSSEAVVVLGFRNRGRRANVVNRWRVRLGLRARQPELGPSRLVLCGGAEQLRPDLVPRLIQQEAPAGPA